MIYYWKETVHDLRKLSFNTSKVVFVKEAETKTHTHSPKKKWTTKKSFPNYKSNAPV